MSDPVTAPFTDADAWCLTLDASTYAGTVAVLRGREVVVERRVAMRGEREERLMPTVVDALAEAGVSPRALAAIVCGAGPGSFTSLRIAASIAKGLAHAAERPLYAAPSLALMVAAHRPPLAPGRYLAVLDALRGDSYAAVVTLGAAPSDVVAYEYLGVVPSADVDDVARKHDARRITAGDESGADHETAAPSARGVIRLGALLAAAGAVDLDSWEPDYGRKAEAQVKWEAAHGRALPAQAVTVDAGGTS
jgi:tRNA threonylcarbamoyladenosine biosynthesis protein TsaB